MEVSIEGIHIRSTLASVGVYARPNFTDYSLCVTFSDVVRPLIFCPHRSESLLRVTRVDSLLSYNAIVRYSAFIAFYETSPIGYL